MGERVQIYFCQVLWLDYLLSVVLGFRRHVIAAIKL